MNFLLPPFLTANVVRDHASNELDRNIPSSAVNQIEQWQKAVRFPINWNRDFAFCNDLCNLWQSFLNQRGMGRVFVWTVQLAFPFR